MFLQLFGQEVLCNDPCLGETIHALADLAVQVSVWDCYVAKFIMLVDVVRHLRKFQSHVFVTQHWHAKIGFFMSIVKYFAPGVDMTLLMRSLRVSRSTVGVPASNG